MKAQREEVEPPTESACALFDGHNAEVPSRASITHLSVSAVVSGSDGLPPFPRVSVIARWLRIQTMAKFSDFRPTSWTSLIQSSRGFPHTIKGLSVE